MRFIANSFLCVDNVDASGSDVAGVGTGGVSVGLVVSAFGTRRILATPGWGSAMSKSAEPCRAARPGELLIVKAVGFVQGPSRSASGQSTPVG